MESTENTAKKKEAHPEVKSLEVLLGENRRIDDALLHALSLVLSTNSEYAKSVHELLDSDLTREQAIGRIDDKIKELVDQTKKLIESQDNLTDLLNAFNENYRDTLDEVMTDSDERQQKYMNSKFSSLFLNLGLQADGTEYSPADKLIIKFKAVLTQQLWLLLVGAGLYHLALLLLKKYFSGS